MQEIQVRNISDKNVIYEVQTDLPEFKGPKTLNISARSSSVYNFSINPKRSGSKVGKIVFFNREDKSYAWYSIKVSPFKLKYSF